MAKQRFLDEYGNPLDYGANGWGIDDPNALGGPMPDPLANVDPNEIQTNIDQGGVTGGLPPPSPSPSPAPLQTQAPAGASPGTDPNKYEAGRVYNPMPGFDTTKLNDLTHQSVKYDFARAVQTLGIPSGRLRGNLAPVISWMQARGYPNAKAVGDDKIDFGDGFGPIDVLQGGTDSIQWIPPSQAGATTAVPTVSAPADTTIAGIPGTGESDLAKIVASILEATGGQTTAGQYANASSEQPATIAPAAPVTPTAIAPAPAAPAAPTPNPNDALLEYLKQQDIERQTETERMGVEDARVKAEGRARLLQLMGQNTGDVQLTDPNLQPQMAAYEKTAQRGNMSNRAALAERMTAEGLGSSGAMDAGIERGNQNTADATAGYGARLVGEEVKARRTEVMQALQLAMQLGATEEENALRRELAQLDAQLRTSALDVSKGLGQGQLNLGLLNSLFGKQGQDDTLGFNYAQLLEQMNRSSLLAGLNG